MILVDTSIWVDHLHRTVPKLVEILNEYGVARHPMVIGELSLGGISNRAKMLGLLAALPAVQIATHSEVSHLVEARRLYGRGLSLVDVHLLASVLLTPRTWLWTRDKRLSSAADEFGVGYHG